MLRRTWGKFQVKHKFSFSLLAIALVSYLFYSYLLLPQWIRRDELKNQHHIERQQVQAVEAFLLAHPNTEQYLVELDHKMLQVDVMLPDDPNISHFLFDIEELSRVCSVQLGYLKPGKITNKEGYREIDVEFSINGEFLQIMSFLSKVEHSLRFVNMSSIGIKIGKDTLEGKLTAKIYSYLVPPVSPALNDKTTTNKK